MLRNNMRRGAYHDYQIVFDGKDWFAWYLDEKLDPMQAAKELGENADN